MTSADAPPLTTTQAPSEFIRITSPVASFTRRNPEGVSMIRHSSF